MRFIYIYIYIYFIYIYIYIKSLKVKLVFYIISTNIDEFRAEVAGEVRRVTSPYSYFFIIKNSLKVMNVQASQPSFKLV